MTIPNLRERLEDAGNRHIALAWSWAFPHRAARSLHRTSGSDRWLL